MIAGIAISIGVTFLILSDPPKTICDVQEEVYRDTNKSFLFKDSDDTLNRTSLVKKHLKECTNSNTPGGCYSLFQDTRRLIQSFQVINSDCYTSISAIKEVKESLEEIYALFIAISLELDFTDESSKPLRWLTLNDVNLFCRVERNIISLYGSERVDYLEQKTYRRMDLSIPFDRFRKFSILSENCQKYL